MHSSFQDISIYSANGFAMFQTEGGNNSYTCAPFPCISVHMACASMSM